MRQISDLRRCFELPNCLIASCLTINANWRHKGVLDYLIRYIQFMISKDLWHTESYVLTKIRYEIGQSKKWWRADCWLKQTNDFAINLSIKWTRMCWFVPFRLYSLSRLIPSRLKRWKYQRRSHFRRTNYQTRPIRHRQRVNKGTKFGQSITIDWLGRLYLMSIYKNTLMHSINIEI